MSLTNRAKALFEHVKNNDFISVIIKARNVVLLQDKHGKCIDHFFDEPKEYLKFSDNTGFVIDYSNSTIYCGKYDENNHIKYNEWATLYQLGYW